MYFAFDRQPERFGINGGWHLRKVIADKKCVVGREQPIIEHGERGLKLRWAGGDENERTFLREVRQRALAVHEGKRNCLCSPSQTSSSDASKSDGGSRKKFPSPQQAAARLTSLRHHRVSSLFSENSATKQA